MGIIKTIKRRFINVSDFFSKKHSLKDKKIIITGSNSGIGLELVKKLVNNNIIIALVNQKKDNLNEIKSKNIKIVQNNFSDLDFDPYFKKEIIEFNPNILINCAANFGPKNQNLEQIEIDDFKKIININAFAPLRLIQILEQCKNVNIIANITSGMASLKNNKSGGYYYYRASKTLLNSISRNLFFDLDKKSINIFTIQPGNVKTKMNSSGIITAEMSSQKIINILSTNDTKFSGKLIDINSKILDW
tara:strand:+ start:85 stop:825 length:741 start_codon:yes stop_codon:yes gene_type:complete